MNQPSKDSPRAAVGQSVSRPLAPLLDALTDAARRGRAEDVMVTGLVTRAEDVEPGNLFVALPGTSADGHAFIADAARRGAAAIVVERDVGGALDAPLVRVPDARRALAELAAEWHGRPADQLALIGITGTAGKTSTLAMLERALLADGVAAGSIGSLGLHIRGERLEETVYTTPDPLVLHSELARLVRAGCQVVAMEATSHALVQERVHGLRYRMGIFTNLLPLEHSEYHANFREYVDAKCMFFDLLEPGAPLVYNHDDPVTRSIIADRELNAVGVGTTDDARVRISAVHTAADGSRLTLEWSDPIPGMDGRSVAPGSLELRTRLLGPANRMNAALAATAALAAGASPAAAARALNELRPPARRLEVVHQGEFTILDDTVGHPESISSFFDVVERLEPRRVHVVYAIRGRRGGRINRANAEALAIWAERIGLETLVITRSDEAADELNRVEAREYDAFVNPLLEHGLEFREVDTLEDAVHTALDAAGGGDLVALLGAQGMNEGQEIARAWLRARARA
jgi:UDP-N-acetylmuramoyl-L-alanyl-D-glutamate--2,6-diaminopimelate ligase